MKQNIHFDLKCQCQGLVEHPVIQAELVSPQKVPQQQIGAAVETGIW